jgi:hypothetical protein
VPIVFAHRHFENLPPPPRPRKGGPFRQRAEFLGTVLLAGGTRLTSAVGLVSLVVGVTVVGLLRAFAGLPWPWAVVIALAVVLLVIAEGAFRLWADTYDVAVRFIPTWQRTQDRADILRTWHDANAPSYPWTQFRTQYVTGHRQAAQEDYDTAETAGFPLTLTRDDLREPADWQAALAIADAFDEAAERWKEAERAALSQPASEPSAPMSD